MTTAAGAPEGSLLDSAVRRQIVDELSNEAGRALTAAEFADILGLHTSTARFHLDQLVSARALTSAYERRGVGRPRKVYLLAERAEPTGAERDLQSLRLLTGLLTEAFSTRVGDRPLTPEEAGEAWAHDHVQPGPGVEPATTPGEWLSKIGGLTDVLTTWGYSPAITTVDHGTQADVRLTHCPFRDLAKENPAVVCGIHRGLIRGTMRRLGESSTDVDLRPFAEGTVCVAHLRHHGSGEQPLSRG